MVYLHAADCGVPVLNSNINHNLSSTLAGSVLMLTCENDTFTEHDEQILHVTCHSNGSWIPDPDQVTCSSFTTVPPGNYLFHQEHLSHLLRKVVKGHVVTMPSRWKSIHKN